ncbi:MAG: nicotinate phosphoribosyltransferase, partial [Oscillospiraceae bacterium]|nr:nicotinate phosphoribosyltransferase [Oscillospiraceae bacterium]
VFKEMRAKGHKPVGIRIDSGDITYLSKRARQMLDDEGFSDVKIVASNSLDEYIIRDLLRQGAKIDLFGVGERMITSKSEPVFGGVYKLVAIEKDEKIVPKIKLSENVTKITNPDFKEVWRLFDTTTGMAIADVLTCRGEIIDETKPYEIFDPDHTYKRKLLEHFSAVRLMEPIFMDGECVYERPSTEDIREYCKAQLDTIWDEVKRFENPHKYYVDLSQKLWDKKNELLRKEYRG